MPRKSAAASMFPSYGNGHLTRLQPGSDMPADAAVVFRHITASTAPGHFVEADRDLLHRYCQAVADARQSDRELVANGFVVDGKPSSWLQIQAQANKAIATLATRLRLSPQSRIDPKTAGSRMPRGAQSVYNLLGLDDEEFGRG